ncbi:MAG: dephospho-CoA kinase [Oscillospiraceae bacterium]|nr:dephospho-CoA kinase [Oscillospiraceae bacterium]
MTELTKHRIVALTGMSGAGKSTVCRCFAESGYFIIDCDISAREVVERGMGSLSELACELSPEVITADGTLDRRRTAELIFNDPERRAVFNRIIYPYITYNVIAKIKSADRDILLDAPTLFDARLQGICDSIVSVCADIDVCVDRIVARDNITRELAAARLGSQHDIGWYRQRSDFCILNNGTQDELFDAAADVITKLKGT